MRNLVGFQIVVILCSAMAFAGCSRSGDPDPGARHYDARGIIRGIAPDRSSVDIEHEDIPGFMPSMTMPFSVHQPNEIADLRTGDAIAFRMTVTDKDLVLDRVKKVSVNDVHLPARTATPTATVTAAARLREGDDLPAFALTDQNGNAVTAETFRGQPLLLTFIFTRCPVPNFCPKMSNNFADLQKAIQGGEIPNVRLLSITLDPAFDSPQVLKQYGAHLNADPNIWTLATGKVDALLQAFSVYRQTEGGTISHGLATALINGDGKVEKIWRGNAWTPSEVIQVVRGETSAAKY